MPTLRAITREPTIPAPPASKPSKDVANKAPVRLHWNNIKSEVYSAILGWIMGKAGEARFLRAKACAAIALAEVTKNAGDAVGLLRYAARLEKQADELDLALASAQEASHGLRPRLRESARESPL